MQKSIFYGLFFTPSTFRCGWCALEGGLAVAWSGGGDKVLVTHGGTRRRRAALHWCVGRGCDQRGSVLVGGRREGDVVLENCVLLEAKCLNYHKGERRAWNARRRAPCVGSRRDGDGYLVLADDGFAQRHLQERVWSKSRI